jgi:hypothetical protein
MKRIISVTLLFICTLGVSAQQPKQGDFDEKKFTFTFAYEKECGSPAEESQIHTFRTGRIVRINSERSVTFFQDTEDGKPSKKEFLVLLAGVNPRGNEKAVREFLNKNLLNQNVDVSGNLRRASDKKFEGLIFLMNESLPEVDWIGEYLIENGLARFSEPTYSYGVSDYSLCVYQQLEAKAKREKLGIWAKAM